MKVKLIILSCLVSLFCVACTTAPMSDEPEAVHPKSFQMVPGNDIEAE